MKWSPEAVEHMGLIPYAVYGGVVHSFKVPGQGDKCYDGNLLDEIAIGAQKKVDQIHAKRNKELAAQFAE